MLAEKFFKEAISLAPEDPFVLAEMGSLYLQTGKWEYALSYLQQVSLLWMGLENWRWEKMYLI